MKKGLSVSVKSFIFSIAVIFLLMVLSYISSFIIPSGAYQTTINESGNTVIIPGTYELVEKSFPFWKFILSPFLIFTTSDSGTLILIIVFLTLIIGSVCIAQDNGIIKYFINKIIYKYHTKRYFLMMLIGLIFMLIGALVGSFEEILPFIPITTLLAVSLGFDAFSGIIISLLSIGAGWSTGVLNPFTTGIAQDKLGLVMFSGTGYRLVCFVIFAVILELFIYLYCKKIVNIDKKFDDYEFIEDPIMNKGSKTFIIVLLSGLLFVVLCSVLKDLATYTIIVIALAFIASCFSSAIVIKEDSKKIFKSFFGGIISIAPSILMIMMASSVKYILAESGTLDTILYYLINLCSGYNEYFIIIMIFIIVLILNFFIPSGSAKVFLIMPLIYPIAQVTGVSLQLFVLAYCFGDGFSNLVYPTNPVLLMGLSAANLGYGEYLKKSAIYHILTFIFSILLLILGVVINY